jgi:hypothetical protein
MTPKELDELNVFREKIGLAPLKPKERKCLKCSTQFISLDSRLCSRCHVRNKLYQSADESRYSVNKR